MTQMGRPLESSFRDPSGFLFTQGGTLYRQINKGYSEHYELLMSSGLYEELVEAVQLIPHASSDRAPLAPVDAYLCIQPEPLSFVSYPYEWCFSQLKDAALLTLDIQRRALEKGMVLKDASAYNVQFHRGKPIFIDTLSFEKWTEGSPWAAYGQFCRHFLAPLAMATSPGTLPSVLRTHLDGIPLDAARRALPWRSRFSAGLQLHLFMHARSVTRHAKPSKALVKKSRGVAFSRRSLTNLNDSLVRTVSAMRAPSEPTYWADYYSRTNYTPKAESHKAALLAQWLEKIGPKSVWDFGANTGRYSKIAAEHAEHVLAFDNDMGSVEGHYLSTRALPHGCITPLFQDLTNPSPALGWGHQERDSLRDRGPCDALLALALVHHLALGNNVPLQRIFSFFASLTTHLIVEFIPKGDEQVDVLLATREDVFANYDEAGFEAGFSAHFKQEERAPLADSKRTLYWLRAR